MSENNNKEVVEDAEEAARARQALVQEANAQARQMSAQAEQRRADAAASLGANIPVVIPRTAVRHSRRVEGLPPSPVPELPKSGGRGQPPKRLRPIIVDPGAGPSKGAANAERAPKANPLLAIQQQAVGQTSSMSKPIIAIDAAPKQTPPEARPSTSAGPSNLAVAVPEPSYEAVSPDLSPTSETVSEGISYEWACVKDMTRHITPHVVQQACEYTTAGWMWHLILGADLQIRSFEQGDTYLMSPVRPMSMTVPLKFNQTPFDTAEAFMTGRLDVWLPSPYVYRLPMPISMAIALHRAIGWGAGPFEPQLKQLKASCITWLQTYKRPSESVDKKYVPAIDNAANECWLRYVLRTPIYLPVAGARHPQQLNQEARTTALQAGVTPYALLAPYSKQLGMACAGGAPILLPKKLRHLSSVRTGKSSIDAHGVTPRPACDLNETDSKAHRTLLAAVAASFGSPTYPQVAWVQGEVRYSVSSNFQPGQLPLQGLVSAVPDMELANKIDVRIPMLPLVVQWGPAPRERVAEITTAAPVMEAGEVSGKKLEAKLAGKIVTEGGIKLFMHPNLLAFSETRPSFKGLLVKGHSLAYQ